MDLLFRPMLDPIPYRMERWQYGPVVAQDSKRLSGELRGGFAALCFCVCGKYDELVPVGFGLIRYVGIYNGRVVGCTVDG